MFTLYKQSVKQNAGSSCVRVSHICSFHLRMVLRSPLIPVMLMMNLFSCANTLQKEAGRSEAVVAVEMETPRRKWAKNRKKLDSSSIAHSQERLIGLGTREYRVVWAICYFPLALFQAVPLFLLLCKVSKAEGITEHQPPPPPPFLVRSWKPGSLVETGPRAKLIFEATDASPALLFFPI